MNRKFIAALVAALALPAAAWAQAPIVIKFSHVAAPDTPKGQGAERFKQLAEERSKGRVRVEVYPNSQLYKDKEELEALQLNSVQMLAPSISKFGPLGVKDFEFFDLPYVTPDLDSFRRVAGSPWGKAALKHLEARGIIGLAYWDAGFRVITANKPLHSVSDFKGLKLRINSSKITQAATRATGAIPQNMAFSEVYLGLQTGVVDGCETVMSNVFTQKFYEVQKFVNLTHHTHQAYAVVVNKGFWESLPADLRATLESAIKDASVYANKLGEDEERDAAQKIRASGRSTIVELTPAERENLQKAMMPAHKELESRVGASALKEFYQAAGFIPPK